MSDDKGFNRNISVTTRAYKNNSQVPPQVGGSVDASKNKKCFSSGSALTKLFINLDLFGKPITLKYSGKDNFRSVFGGLFAFSCLALMLFWLGYSLAVFAGRSAPTYSSISETKSLPDDMDLGSFTENMDWSIGIDIF